MSKKLVIIGTSDLGQIAYEYFKYDSNYEVSGFAVEQAFRKEDKLFDLPIINLEEINSIFPANQYAVFVAITYLELNRVRTRIYESLKNQGYEFASYVSSKSFVWKNVEIGENCFIFENNTVQPFSKIGNNVILWSGNHIGHHSIIENNCFISSHVVISGHCEIGENCFIGVNSAISNNLKIAKDNFLAIGSVITKNTEENKIYKGNPAEASKISALKYFKIGM